MQTLERYSGKHYSPGPPSANLRESATRQKGKPCILATHFVALQQLFSQRDSCRLLLAMSATAQRVKVLQPHQSYAGMSYSQWSAAWWQWAAGISEPNSPLDDATGAHCAVGQSGPVWFLAGTTASGPVTRRCDIPAGRAILFPIINGECSIVEGYGTTVGELRRCARNLLSGASDIAASIDGRPLDLGRDARRFGFESPEFIIAFAPNNAFYPDGSVVGSGRAVAYGYWVMLRPPSSGTHTVAFKARIPEFDFAVDVSYTLAIDCRN